MRVSLQIRDSQRDPVNAELDVVPISIGQRIGRAAIRLVVCWALAVATLFVPLLHFVLVPGFAVLGPVMAFLAFRPTVKVTSTSVTCPKCEKVSTIEEGTTGWPATLRCSHCSTTFFAKPT